MRLNEIRARRYLRKAGRRALDTRHITAARRRYRSPHTRITTRPWSGR